MIRGPEDVCLSEDLSDSDRLMGSHVRRARSRGPGAYLGEFRASGFALTRYLELETLNNERTGWPFLAACKAGQLSADVPFQLFDNEFLLSDDRFHEVADGNDTATCP